MYKVVINSFDEIYNFYAIKNVFFSKNWFFTDFEKTIKSVQSYHNLWKPLFYTYWIAQEYPNYNNIKLKNRLKNFISSSENFCLNNNNLGKF